MRLFEISNTSLLIEDDSESEILLTKYQSQVDFAINKFKTTGSAIYKGGNYEYGKVQYRDTAAFDSDRSSANTANYYTMIMDHSKKWKHFPKRGRSLICSTDSGYAEMFGNVAVVVPLTNVMIGVCPDNDIWGSFYNESGLSLEEINKIVQEILNRNKIQGTYDTDKATMFSKFKQAKFNDETLSGNSWNSEIEGLIKKYGIKGMYERILDPEGFQLISWHDFNITANDSAREVWFSGQALMIAEDLWEKLTS